jgi:hypothetical protein
MSDSKAGSMAASMMWAFAIGSCVLGAILGFFAPGFLGFLLGTAIYIAGGWAAVHMTQSTTGKGILGMLVGALAAAVVGFILWKTAASSAMGAAGSSIDDAMKQAQANNGGQPLTAEQQAAMAQAGNIMKSAGGVIVGVTAAFFGLLKAFIFGMVGCFIGGATKKSAGGGSASMQKAA